VRRVLLAVALLALAACTAKPTPTVQLTPMKTELQRQAFCLDMHDKHGIDFLVCMREDLDEEIRRRDKERHAQEVCADPTLSAPCAMLRAELLR
jgi:type IV pilus biogenesis protein CpaD/CtpE